MILFSLIFGSLSVFAHPPELSVLDVTSEAGALKVSLQLNPVDVARLSHIPLPPPRDWLTSLAPRIFFSTLGSSVPEAGGKPCRWRNPSVRNESGPDGDHVTVSATAVCGTGAFRFPLRFLEGASEKFRVVGNLQWEGKASWVLASRERPVVEPGIGILYFVHLGVEHIGATPGQWVRGGRASLPEGIDHILFVLALVLGGASLSGMLKSVSGFTVGHSVTLLLASFGWVSAPQRLVEIGIALSIAMMALLVALGRRGGERWQIATLFGLVHGLGFASALSNLGLSGAPLFFAVFGFNVGVELAQLLIVLVAAAPLWLLKKKSKLVHGYALRFAGLAIACAGGYWVVERVLVS